MDQMEEACNRSPPAGPCGQKKMCRSDTFDLSAFSFRILLGLSVPPVDLLGREAKEMGKYSNQLSFL